MNKLYIFCALFLVFGIGMASAAITGCLNSTGQAVVDDTGAWPAYNDTGTPTAVTDGQVCVSATDYDVVPNATYKCSLWYDYVNNTCTVNTYYVGFLSDMSGTCSATGWVTAGPVIVAQGYVVNTTIASAPNAQYETNTGRTVPALNACSNAYTETGPTGYCNGAGSLDTAGHTVHVSAGKVCSAGAGVSPNSTANCATWYNCVSGATTYATYYTGYAASGSTCSATGWVATGNTFTMLAGTQISFTADGTTDCATGLVSSNTSALAGIQNVRDLAYAGLALLALGVLVLVAFGLIQVFKGGNVDFMMITITAIGLGVVVLIAFVILYFVSKALGL